MADEEKWKELYQNFQVIQQQMERIAQNLEILNEQNAELDISIGAVQELGKTEIDNDILAPLANGIFLKAKLQDNEKLIVNVGSDTTVEKTVDEVAGLLKEQKNQISQRIIELEALLGEMQKQSLKIYENMEQGEE